MVTSPHHLGATMVTERTHRMTELFGRLAPGASVESARAELTALHAAMMREHPEAYSAQSRRPAERHAAARSDHGAGADDPARAARRRGDRVRHRLLERRQPDSRAVGPPRRRAGGARRARREPRRAAADAARREPGALRRRRGARRLLLARPFVAVVSRLCGALLRARARSDGRREPALGRRRPRDRRGACCSRTSRVCRRRHAPAGLGLASGSVRITPGTNRRLRVFATTQIAFSFVLLAGAGDAARRARRPADAPDRLRHASGAGDRPADAVPRHRRRRRKSSSTRR